MQDEIEAYMALRSRPALSYWFYNHTVELQYHHNSHTYLLVTPEGLVPQAGVSDTCHIIDKSMALVPWACNMMADKILATVPYSDPDGNPAHRHMPAMAYSEFEGLVLAAKLAHKEKLDHAAHVGNLAHDWIESLIKYELNSSQGIPYIPMPENEQAKNCCRAAVDWMHKHNVRWISTEQRVYSKLWQFAGTMDGLCHVDSCSDRKCCRSDFKDRLSIADWKSSNELRTEYLLQTAAYMQAYTEEHEEVVADRWVIRLGKDDGEFDPWHLEGDSWITDFDAFTLALDLKRTLKVIDGRMKERASEIRQVRKEERQEARQEALAIKCNGADRYKGVRRPACNGGNPCQTCIAKYQQTHPPELWHK